jgi:tetratricopeptide (TPR) repeat protein
MNVCAMQSYLARRTPLTIGLILVLTAWNLAAQSVTIFGSVEEAHTCMSGAETAANMHIGARSDVEACTFAIQSGRLSRRDQAATYCNRGVIKAAMELYQEAFEDYNAAMDLMAELPEPYVGRGNVYFLAERLDEAIADYTRAMDLELGRMHVAFLNRGMAYELQGHLDLAEADYRQAVDLAPQWPLAQQKLAKVVAKRQGATEESGVQRKGTE